MHVVGPQDGGRTELTSPTLPTPASRILPPLPGVDVGPSQRHVEAVGWGEGLPERPPGSKGCPQEGMR